VYISFVVVLSRCLEAKDDFLSQVKESVQASLSRVAEAPPAGCSILFTEPRPAHDKIRTRIFGTRSVDTDGEYATGAVSVSSSSSNTDRVSTNLADKYDDNMMMGSKEGASEPFFEALVAEVKKPFVYDCSNEVSIMTYIIISHTFIKFICVST